jgi:hypothetical protein
MKGITFTNLREARKYCEQVKNEGDQAAMVRKGNKYTVYRYENKNMGEFVNGDLHKKIN